MTSDQSLYGQSLYDVAADEGITGELLEELVGVKAVFSENPDYIRLLSEPSIPKKERLELVDKAFSGEIHPYLLNFLKILLENGLLRSFPSCVSVFRSNYNRDNGIAEATVTSAVELSEEEKTELLHKLESLSGKKVLLKNVVDSSVLGGIRVELDGRLYDGTVSGRLADIRKKISQVVV